MKGLDVFFITAVLIMISFLLTGIITYWTDFFRLKKSGEKLLCVRTVIPKNNIIWIVISILQIFLCHDRLLSSIKKMPDGNLSMLVLGFCGTIIWVIGLFIYLELSFLPVFVSEKHIFGINGLFSAEKYTYSFGKKEDDEENMVKIFYINHRFPLYRIKNAEKIKYHKALNDILINNYKINEETDEKGKRLPINKKHLVIFFVIFALLMSVFLFFWFNRGSFEIFGKPLV